MLVLYLGMFEKARMYERYDYDMIEVLGNTGAIYEALYIIGSILVFYFVDINQTVKVFEVFKSIIRRGKDGNYKEEIK